MQAVEFVSKAHGGMVDLPREHQNWNSKQMHVILLEATSKNAKRKPIFTAATISHAWLRFDRDAA